VTEFWEPVPATIVEVVPAWRSYRVVRIHGDIVVIDPDTFEIVYVM
jgi:predicted FMN-binding regulatory protein PaiB